MISVQVKIRTLNQHPPDDRLSGARMLRLTTCCKGEPGMGGVAIPDALLLLAMGRADVRIHIEPMPLGIRWPWT